ncbi:DUF2945 domain-containing protein [Yoonia sp. BS5-3]|uniref:DUF2945 domain-containing protein n=1 Tax=Yoonia phaeophyticola TaxID=3137369 RepID=A0ABZ2UYR1_9RHOB
MTFHVGDAVTWNWGSGTAKGKVVEKFTDDVTRSLQGAEVTRNASSDQPAFLIEQDDGAQVLKSCTEIETS